MTFYEWYEKHTKGWTDVISQASFQLAKEAWAACEKGMPFRWETEDGMFWYTGDTNNGCGVNKDEGKWWGTVVINGKAITNFFKTKLEAFMYCEELWRDLNKKQEIQEILPF